MAPAPRTSGASGPGEFDLDSEKPTWTVPWQRTKTGKRTQEPHIVPLSPQAVACLRRLEVRAGGVDLPDTRPGRLPVGPRRPRATDYCPIPSLFLDWAAEQTGYRYEIKEALSTIRWGTTCDDAMNGRVGLTSGGPWRDSATACAHNKNPIT